MGGGHFNTNNHVTPTLSWVRLRLGWAVTIYFLHKVDMLEVRILRLVQIQRYQNIVITKLQLEILGKGRRLPN